MSNFPVPSSTVIVLRDSPRGPEVFMVRRHAETAVMAGQHVFPGGRVDAGDRGVHGAAWFEGCERTTRWPGLSPDEALAYSLAAARELFEEAGVLLARTPGGELLSMAAPDERRRFERHRRAVHGGTLALGGLMAAESLCLALDELAPWAHWVTPPVTTRRFDTRFFVARVPPGQTPVHDDTETTDGAWTTAADALELGRAGAIVLPPPTWMTLVELAPLGSVEEILRSAGRRELERREPLLVEAGGTRMLIMPGDPEYGQGARAGDDPDRPRFETRFVWRDSRWRATYFEGSAP